MDTLILILIFLLLAWQQLKRKPRLPKATSSVGLYPVNDFVLVLPEEDDNSDKFINTREIPPLKGIVKGVGPGTAHIRMQVSIGQRVYYQRGANATMIPHLDVEYLFMRQSDLIGIDE